MSMSSYYNHVREYNDGSEESRYDVGGGPLLIPALMFLIIACVCGQTCFCVHRNYPHWFIIVIKEIDNIDNDDITVETILKRQDDNHNNNAVNKHKKKLDVITNNNDLPTNITPPKMIRVSRRNSIG
jgi:hypothetical protein